MKLEDDIRNLIEPSINELGLKLDSVVYEKESNMHFLRIIIDSDSYITVNNCISVTEKINPILDEKDIIKDAYILDVCSKEKE